MTVRHMLTGRWDAANFTVGTLRAIVDELDAHNIPGDQRLFLKRSNGEVVYIDTITMDREADDGDL